MGSTRCRKLRADFVQAGPLADRGQGGGQGSAFGCVKLHIVSGHHVGAHLSSNLHECVVAGRVQRMPVVPEFDDDVLASERCDKPFQLSARRRRAIVYECLGDRSPARAGQHHPREGRYRPGELAELFHGDPRVSFGAGKLGLADRPSHLGVALRPSCQQHDVCRATRAMMVMQGQLDTEHGRQTMGSGGFCESDNAVKPIAVG